MLYNENVELDDESNDTSQISADSNSNNNGGLPKPRMVKHSLEQSDNSETYVGIDQRREE